MPNGSREWNDYAWMSQASYLDLQDLLPDDPLLNDRLQNDTYARDKRFASKQADTFTSSTTGYSFIRQQPNQPSGFSASVFQSNERPGEYTIAVRGTEPFAQGAADLLDADLLGIVLTGQARRQVVDSYRYYKRLIGTVGPVQYTTSEVERLVIVRTSAYGGRTLADLYLTQEFRNDLRDLNAALAQDQGLGIIPAGSKVNFTGHSLGGHVAVLAAELAGEYYGAEAVGQVFTYNAPGQFNLAYEIQNWLGNDTSRNTGVLTGKVTNIIAEGGLNVTAGLGSLQGPKQAILIESQPGLSIANHSIVLLSDALSVYDLYARIDSGAGALARIKAIVAASAVSMPDSLEAALDALRKIFFGKDVSLTKALGVPDDRGVFYANLAQLQALPAYQGLSGSGALAERLLSLADLAASTLATEATTNFAQFFALKTLSPLALANAESLYQAVSPALYAQWQADQGVNNPSERRYTSHWLADRAQFLDWLLQRNSRDLQIVLAPGAREQYLVQDADSATQMLVSPGPTTVVPIRYISFGGSGADVLEGGSREDHLYGDQGFDVLHGGKGNDYLEGDEGDDELFGEEDSDILVGGVGDDRLVGGAGDDQLFGGSGDDIYVVADGDGSDTIEDSDGRGHIEYNGRVLGEGLSGDDWIGPGAWRKDNITYSFDPGLTNIGTLVIHAGGLFTTVREFRSGQLGISLDNPTAPPLALETFAGTDRPDLIRLNRENTEAETIYSQADGGGSSDYIEGADTLVYTAPPERLNGQGGDDWINPFEGNDMVDAGPGNDLVTGIFDQDIVRAGAGDDIVAGNQALILNIVAVSGQRNGIWTANDVWTDLQQLWVHRVISPSPVDGGNGSLTFVFENSFGETDITRNSMGLGLDPTGKIFSTSVVPGLAPLTYTLRYDASRPITVPAYTLTYDGALSRPTYEIGQDRLSDITTAPRVIFGEAGNDLLIGGLGDDLIDGGEDDDKIAGNKGDDTLMGDSGKDLILGGAGNDYLTGDAGEDKLWGEAGDDTLLGGDDDDILYGDSEVALAYGSDYLDGGQGNDTLIGDGGDDEIYGGEGNDQLFGDADWVSATQQGDDYLDGEEGNDFLRGYGGNDTLIGGKGDDDLRGEAGDDDLDGDEGDDTIDGGAGNDIALGGAGNDHIDGGEGDDVLDGGEDDDVLIGGAGNDTLIGGAGNNRLEGGAGDDVYILSGSGDASVIVDAEGENRIELAENFDSESLRASLEQSTDGASYLHLDFGAAGSVYLSSGFATGPTSSTSVHLANGTTLNQADLISTAFSAPLIYQAGNGAEHVTGGRGNDRLTGSDQGDVIDGGAGDDQIVGLGGNDTLNGQEGNDRLLGGAGADMIAGDVGDDVLEGGDGDDRLEGGLGSDTYRISRYMGRDTLSEVAGAGDANTLLLDAGVSTSDLRGRREINNLYLHFSNSRDGVVVQDYFAPGNAASALWQIKEASGATTTLAGFVDSIQTEPGATNAAQAWAQFKARAENYYAGVLYRSGYEQTSSGTFIGPAYSGSDRGPLGRDLYTTITVRTLLDWSTDSSPGATLGVRRSPFSSYTPGVETIESRTHTYTIYPDRPFIPNALGGNTTPQFIDVNNLSGSFQTLPGQVLAPVYGESVIDPETRVSTRPILGWYRSSPTYQAPLPRTVSEPERHIERTDTNLVNPIAEIVGNGSNEALYAIGYDFLDGGDGNDILSATDVVGRSIDELHVSGLYRSTPGYSETIGVPGSFLYGNAGNDTLLGHRYDDVLSGGTGNDFLFGAAGNDTYLFFTGDGQDVVYEDGITAPGETRDNVLVLPAGALAQDLRFGWGERIAMVDTPSALNFRSGTVHAALTISWSATDSVTVVIPHTDQNAGLGLDFVELGNGTRLAFADVIAMAGPTPSFDPHLVGNLTLIGTNNPDDLSGGVGDDLMRGLDEGDTLIGNEGYDTIEGGDGNDTLIGGRRQLCLISNRFGVTTSSLWESGNLFRGNAGDDRVIATAGSDVFEFNLGDGKDTVIDKRHDAYYINLRRPDPWQNLSPDKWTDADLTDSVRQQMWLTNHDTLRFGAGITAADVRIERRTRPVAISGNYDDLVFVLRNGTDEITFGNFFVADHNQLDRVEFADGSAIEINAAGATSGAAVLAFNQAPVLAYPIADQAVTEGSSFNFFVPAGAITDEDVNDALDFSATLWNGQALPSWLAFDPIARRFSGTPGHGDVGVVEIDVAATDSSGARASDRFRLEVVSNTVNRAPTVGAPISNQMSAEDVPFTFTLPTGAFIDPDTNDTLAFTVSQASDSPLPAWLAFDAATRTFSGTPTNSDVGTLDLRVTATDTRGASVASFFTLDVTNVNDAPTLKQNIPLQSARSLTAFRLTLPEDTFTDVDRGDAVTLSARQAGGPALPAWLAFDPATRAFVGTPARADVGALRLEVTATDTSGAQASVRFDLIIVSGNEPPILARSIADQSTLEDAPVSFVLPTNTFIDPDAGDRLAYTATRADGTALPAWLRFDAATQTFSGVPTNDEVGALALKVTATDQDGETASGSFTLNVLNVNDAPTLVRPITAQAAVEDAAFSFSVPVGTFVDIDAGDSLTYAATRSDDTPLPTWLRFDPATRVFSGVPINDDVGALSIQLVATDRSGASVGSAFDIAVANTNDAPTVGRVIANQSLNEDTAFDFALPANTFIDVDRGDNLVLSATRTNGTSLPAWLRFDPSTQRFSGTPGNDDVSVLAVRVAATDQSGASATTDFELAVMNVNDAPTVANAPGAQAAIEDTVFSFMVPANAFTDVDVGDSLAYTATQSDGRPLPAWLRFDPAARTFSGTPANNDVGTIDVRLTATDQAGASAKEVFSIAVANANDAPAVVNPIADQTGLEQQVFSFTVPANAFGDIDVGDRLSYTARLAGGGPLPGWLTFNAASRALAGTPALGDYGEYSIEMSVTDLTGASVSDTFTLTIGAQPRILFGGGGADTLAGASNNDFLYGGAGVDTLRGLAGNDYLDGGAGADRMEGGTGDDIYIVDSAGDAVIENPNEGVDTVFSAISYTLPDNVENLLSIGTDARTGIGNVLDNTITGGFGNNTIEGRGGNDLLAGNLFNDTLDGGDGDDRLYGFAGNDRLIGGAGNDLLDGGVGMDQLSGDAGNDLLQGGADNDTLSDISGKNLLDGGAGTDSLVGGAGNELFIGGSGADTIDTGGGADVIAYNRGDGADVIRPSTGQDNTLSLGGGIRYSDIRLTKTGSNLDVELGGNGDKITLEKWYQGTTNKSVLNLQVIAQAMVEFNPASADPLLNRKVENFDFNLLVSRYDQARTTQPTIARWSVMSSLLDAHLAGSDTQAIGGDLTYRYGVSGTLTGMNLVTAQETVNATAFGNQQAISANALANQGAVRLA